MRFNEFIEHLPALINKTANIDGIQVSINTNEKNASSYASSNGRRLGYAEFDRDGNTLVPYDLAVDDKYRGQGIAAVMYDYVKSLGFKIQASAEQTDAGKYFWAKNRGDQRVWEAEQRMMEPELYEDVPTSILKRAVQAALPGVQLQFRTTPEGYLNVTNDEESVILDIGMSIYDSELSFNVENAYLTKYAKGGVMTNIIANAFKLAEKKYGIPRSRSLGINQDRSYGVWQRIADKLGLKYSAHQIGENFADGKVKGKSRPGRVKRAGASCNGSVTDLRRKAKNASGERAKMYHWCANMKSGKKK
jgi:GNAT superfamily N-acetyltransferase